jgi:hypothetical protein
VITKRILLRLEQRRAGKKACQGAECAPSTDTVGPDMAESHDPSNVGAVYHKVSGEIAHRFSTLPPLDRQSRRFAKTLAK